MSLPKTAPALIIVLLLTIIASASTQARQDDLNCPSLPMRLVIGERGQSIIDGTGSTNARPNPGVGTPTFKIQEGENFLVTDGPICGIATNGDHMRYIQIENSSGQQGWIPEANDQRYFMEPQLTQAEPTPLEVSEVGSGNTLDQFHYQREIELSGAYIYALTFSPDGKFLVTGTTPGIVVWDVGSGEQLRSFQMGGAVTSLAFRPDGKILAIGVGATLQLYDFATGVKLKEADTGQFEYSTRMYPNVIGNIEFNSDGSLIATGSAGDIDIWDAGSLQRIINIKTGHTPKETLGGVIVAFSPDGQTVASGGTVGKGEVVLWNTHTGQEQRVFLRDYSAPGVSGLAFYPDGSRIVASFADGTIRIWDITSGQEVASYKDNSVNYTRVVNMTLRNDGRILVASQDNGVVLWDTISGQKIGRLGEYTTAPSIVKFDSSGEFLAIVTSLDGKPIIHLWRSISDNRFVVATIDFEDGTSFMLNFNPLSCEILNGTEFVLSEINRVLNRIAGLSQTDQIIELIKYASPIGGEVESIRKQVEAKLLELGVTCRPLPLLRYKVGTEFMDTSGLGNIVYGYFTKRFNIPVLMQDAIANLDQIPRSFLADLSIVFQDNLDDILQRKVGQCVEPFTTPQPRDLETCASDLNLDGEENQ